MVSDLAPSEDPTGLLLVHQVRGVLMGRHGTSIEEAVAYLHELAVLRGVNLVEVAGDVVHRRGD
jgi:AmiR/NasT family two-component response regulator